MLASAISTAQSVGMVFAFSLALALISSGVPWLACRLRSRYLVLALVVGIVVGVTAGVVGAARGVPLLPLTDLVVLVVAWSGGLLLGREMPARFSPFLLLFLCLSVLDVLQALGGYPVAPHTANGSSPVVAASFVLVLPWGRFAINVADLLLLTAVAEHWRRRGAGYLIALLPGALGFFLADGLILLTGLAQLPGIPFFTIGYLGSEALFRSLSRRAG